jgi:2',3'-cyclic-nucleotide 2'-phosphodiesterase (5'-nucleotidase family)
VGLGGKLNLFQSKDPLYDPALLDSLDNIHREGKRERRIRIKEIELEIEKLDRSYPRYSKMRDSLNNEISKVREEILALDISKNETFRNIKKQYINDNWNASYLDLAFGNRFTTNNELDSFEVSGNRTSVWLNGSYGIGKNVLVSSMLQYTQDNENEFSQIMFGANFRYGNGNYNFFIETYVERNELKGINKNEHYISYGGEFNINRNILLDYSLRVRNVKDVGFREFVPVVNIRCLMR